MGQGQQAKILTERQEKRVLLHLGRTRYPERNRAMFLLSVKAGLRAKEIASLTWSMATDADGHVTDEIHLTNDASKGRKGGRTIPMNSELRDALADLQTKRGDAATVDAPVIYSERGRGMSADTVALWFLRLYRTVGLEGCSSHSGRRTFITRAAHKIVEAGGSLRDVQQLAGHTALSTTQRYIEGNNQAKRKVVEMV